MIEHLPHALDPDLPVPAAGEASVEAISCGEGAFTAGTWTHAGGILHISGEYDEVCVLLDGHVRLVDAAGHTAEFKAGETFVIPKGFQGTWETVESVRKHYVIFNPRASRG